MQRSMMCRLAALAALAAWSATAETPAGIPRLVCDAPVYDFGEAENTQPVDHTFVLKNDGTAPLEIAQVRSGCGCTKAETATNHIPAGGQTTLSARLSLHGRAGPQRINIYVHSNDPERPYYQLQFTGTALAGLAVSPPSVMLMAPPEGGVISQTVAIVNRSATPLAIHGIQGAGPGLSVSLITNEPGRAFTLDLRAEAPANSAPLSGMLLLETDRPDQPVVTIPFAVRAHAPLAVAPRELVFSVTPDPQAQTRYLVLRSTAQRAFRILAMECSTPGVPIDVLRSGEFWYHLRIGPVVPTEDLNDAMIRVTTDLPGAERVEVPVRVMGTPAGNAHEAPAL